MFKTFAGIYKYNFQTVKNRILLERRQVRCFYKILKTKKMLRTWEFTQEARDFQKQGSKGHRPLRQYRLVSYNILAQDLLVEHYYLYQGMNSQHLRWEHRLNCLKNELIYLDPDILCVQEMQFNHIKEFVSRLNENRKLEYVFKKKTGHRSDGCAIIYDREKFTLIAEKEIEFYKPNQNNLNRENIALMAKFQLRQEPGKHLIIGTTHLLFNPRRHDVRVAQVELLLEGLEKFARKSTGETKSYFPLILSGDFNSEFNTPPFIQLTSPYQAVPEGVYVEPNTTTSGEAEDADCSIIEENRYIKPAYPPFKLSAVDFGHSCASTFHDRWLTVDYVLRLIKDSDREDKEISDVKVLSIYKLPTVRNCERIGKIPNQYLGSDHYLEAIDFLVV